MVAAIWREIPKLAGVGLLGIVLGGWIAGRITSHVYAVQSAEASVRATRFAFSSALNDMWTITLHPTNKQETETAAQGMFQVLNLAQFSGLAASLSPPTGAVSASQISALGAYGLCIDNAAALADATLFVVSHQPLTSTSLKKLTAARNDLSQVVLTASSFETALQQNQPGSRFTKVFNDKCLALQQFANQEAP